MTSLRLVLSALFALVGTAGAVLAAAVLWSGDASSPPTGDVSVSLRPLASAAAILVLLVCGIVAVVAATTLVTTLVEARAVRRRP